MQTDFVYLASASPRRRALLAQIGVAFSVLPAGIDESRQPNEAAAAYVERLACQKAAAVWMRVVDDPAPVVAADTAVLVDDQLLGKPSDAAAAESMLTALSGRQHAVLTAVAVCWRGQTRSRLSRNEVRFRATTPAERSAYCRTGEPLDKAGGYGIQGRGAVFVEHLSGSYSAVMGLPLFETAALLGELGIPGWLHPT